MEKVILNKKYLCIICPHCEAKNYLDVKFRKIGTQCYYCKINVDYVPLNKIS